MYRVVSLTLLSLLTLCFSALIFMAAGNTVDGASRGASTPGQAIARNALSYSS